MMIALALPQSLTREAVGNELGAYEVFLRRTSRCPRQSGNSTGNSVWNLVIENINNGRATAGILLLKYP